MSDKNFEESVRQKMEELKFHPTEAVWSRIEAELPAKDRRRRIIFWLPVAACLMLLIYLGQRYAFDENPSRQQNEIVQSEKVPGKDDIVTPKPGNRFDKSETDRKEQDNSNIGIDADSKTSRDYQNPDQTIERNNILEPVRKNNLSEDVKVNTTPFRINNFNEVEQVVQTTTYAIPDMHVDRLSQFPKIKTDVVVSGDNARQLIENLQINERLNSGATEVNAKKKNTSASKWKFSGSIAAGVAGMNDGGVLDLRTATLADYSSTVPTYSNINRAPVYSVTNVNPGLYYSAEFNAERMITQRWSVSAGVGYARFNTSMEVGWQKRKLSMHHDLIDVPVRVSFHTRNISYSAGLIGSKMLSAQTYRPSASNGFGYDRVEKLRESQFAITAGADIRILKKTGRQITVGPVFRYHLSSLYSNLNAEQHLASGAVHMKWYLKN